MTIRQRKLVGTVLLLVYFVVYALLAMRLAIALHVYKSKLVELLFYPIVGLAWIPLAMLLIRWMLRPDPPSA